MSRILIIDTVDPVRVHLANFLRDEGHFASYARDFNQVQRVLNRSVNNDRPFDFICLDSFVGTRKGPEILSSIRRLTGYADVIVAGAIIGEETDVWANSRDLDLRTTKKITYGNHPEHYWNAEEINKLVTAEARPVRKVPALAY